MNKSYKIVLFFTTFLILAFSTLAQQNNVRVGGEKSLVPSSLIEANSAGIKYKSNQISYISENAKSFIVSYSSDEGKIIVKENIDESNRNQPFTAGTDIEGFIGSAIKGDINSNTQAENLSYAMVLESRSAGYAYAFDRSFQTFNNDLSDLSGQRIESIDTYGINTRLYAGTWTNDNSGWVYTLNNSDANTFIDKLNQWPDGSTRYRPTGFVFYSGANYIHFGATGKADSKGFAWVFGLGSLTSLYNWVDDQYANSRRIVDIEIYRDLNGNTYFGAISESATYGQRMAANLSYTDFTNRDATNAGENFRLADYERYYVNGTYLYSGVWSSDGTAGWWYYAFSNSTDFVNAVTNKINEGYKPSKLQINDGDWTVAVDDEEITDDFSLSQNYPNPFNPSTKINYVIKETQAVKLELYNSLGQKLKTIVNETKAPGSYEIEFDGKDLSSGIYFYTLTTGSFKNTKKMTLLK